MKTRLAIVAMAFFPTVAQAIPVSLIPLERPDINISNTSTLFYNASTNVFTVAPFSASSGAELAATGPGLVIAPDGTQFAGEGLQLRIDALIDGTDTSSPTTILSSGGELLIQGTIFDDNTVGGALTADGDLLTGDLIEAGNDGSFIQLAWSITGGTYAGAYGGVGATAITQIDASGIFDTALGFGEDFGSALPLFTTDTRAAVIPVPAGLPLLLGGLMSLVLLRGRQTER